MSIRRLTRPWDFDGCKRVYTSEQYGEHMLIRRLGELEDVLCGPEHAGTCFTIERLQEIVRADFNGKLKILKVKPGGVIYLLYRMSTGAIVEAVQVAQVNITERTTSYLCRNNKGDLFEVSEEMHGTIMFYTLEEVETAKIEYDRTHLPSPMKMEE